MPTTTKVKERHGAFCFRPQLALAIWNLIDKAGCVPSLSMRCSDGSTIDSEELETLLNFPNTRLRQITKLRFRNGYRGQPRIELELSNKLLYGPTIEYEVMGNDQDVIYSVEKLEEQIASAFQWYAFIYRTPNFIKFMLELLGYVLGPVIIVFGLLGMLDQSSKTPHVLVFGLTLPIFVITIGIIFLCVSLAVKRLIPWIFPPAIFAIGYGAQQAERVVNRQRMVLGTLIFGLLVGIVASLIANKISR
jgi:hypothetical protein